MRWDGIQTASEWFPRSSDGVVSLLRTACGSVTDQPDLAFLCGFRGLGGPPDNPRGSDGHPALLLAFLAASFHRSAPVAIRHKLALLPAC